jgi:hypothetical protein
MGKTGAALAGMSAGTDRMTQNLRILSDMPGTPAHSIHRTNLLMGYRDLPRDMPVGLMKRLDTGTQ